MGYQALLFCPDEKTARTVTQVLGELEFTVEACIEPFAAVKKLMSDHFDAIVVDCDNEQNATLLFKSARNSTSNQASLAVAVVEGQVGVAKAFRIGANLVLTKPINIEQSKGTLRVARGLLRKGDPAKPGAPAATAPAPAAAAAPAKPAAARPVAPTKPAVPAAAATPRPAAPVAKPAPASAPVHAAAAASSTPAAQGHSEDLSKINLQELIAEPTPAPAPRLPALGSQAASIEVTSGFKSAPSAPAPTFGSGAASAPAPAREVQHSHIAEAAPVVAAHAEPAAIESHASTSPAPSFTFGGANVAETKGGSKKILLGIAAAALVAAGLYVGWTYFQGRSSQPTSIPTTTIPAPVSTPQTAKPASALPKPAATTTTSATPLNSQSAAQPLTDATVPSTTADEEDNQPDSGKAAAPVSTKTSKSASSPASKPADTKSEAAPLVVKGGSAPAVHAKPAAVDAPAPSLIGMATPGSSAPPPNLVGGTGDATKPVLQTLNISQGVSQGLLVKKVQPIYPRNALTMHVEGAVDLLATISTTGNITAVKVISGEQLLTKAAADAVKQWKYKPYLLNGEPVEIQTEITVNFKLPH